jgi:hypothetical protein
MLYETDTYKTIISYNSVWREYLSVNSPYNIWPSVTLSVRPDAHWDADRINGVDSSGNPSDGATMVNWVSLIGNYTFLAHNTSSEMPVWKDGASTWGNNLPCVRCTADYMELENALCSATDQAFTIWSVGKKDASGATYGPIGTSDAYLSAGYFSHTNGDDFIAYGGTAPSGSGATGTKYASPPVGFPITGEAQTWMLERDASSVLRQNHHGNNRGNAAPTYSLPHTFHNLGRTKTDTNLFATNNSEVYEIMIFPRDVLSALDKNALGTYADNKYGFTTSPSTF